MQPWTSPTNLRTQRVAALERAALDSGGRVTAGVAGDSFGPHVNEEDNENFTERTDTAHRRAKHEGRNRDIAIRLTFEQVRQR